MTTLFKDAAINRAGSNKTNFAQLCYKFARRSVSKRHKFTSEDLIQAYERKGNPVPDDRRVWGVVMVKLIREGVIKHSGFAKYKNPNGHQKPVNVWKTI